MDVPGASQASRTHTVIGATNLTAATWQPLPGGQPSRCFWDVSRGAVVLGGSEVKTGSSGRNLFGAEEARYA